MNLLLMFIMSIVYLSLLGKYKYSNKQMDKNMYNANIFLSSLLLVSVIIIPFILKYINTDNRQNAYRWMLVYLFMLNVILMSVNARMLNKYKTMANVLRVNLPMLLFSMLFIMLLSLELSKNIQKADNHSEVFYPYIDIGDEIEPLNMSPSQESGLFKDINAFLETHKY